ncbi:MAG: hypothetical protein ACT4OJ_04880 [Bacteroidota bacterium]
MKKVLFLLLILSACNQKKDRPVTTEKVVIPPDSTTKTAIVEELPPAKTCQSDLGVLRMDANGHSVGSNTEMTALRNFLKANECDIIEVTYELKGSYGDNISKRIVYNKREMTLKDIYTTNNVIEDYSGVTPEGLKKYLEKGEKDFYGLEEYAGASYDFNNREMTIKAVGPAPAQDELDGSVAVVREYIKANAKDASSIVFIEWSKVTPLDKFWVVRCKYKGTNSYGGIETENKWFFIQNNKVVKEQ